MNPRFLERPISRESYAYGTRLMNSLHKALEGLRSWKYLFPCRGRRPKCCIAATKGWKVWASDQSEEGKKKALKLAKDHNVEIHTMWAMP
jgi:hypothetical protein